MMDYKKDYYVKNNNFHRENKNEKISEIIKILENKDKPKSVLDIACGAGDILKIIAKKYNIERGVGIDISKLAIKEARKDLDKNQNLEFLEMDIFNYKINNKFDLALMMDIVEHIEDDKNFLEFISNLANSFIIKVPIENVFINKFLKFISFGKINACNETYEKYGHIHHYSRKDFIDLLKQIEFFEIIEINNMPMPKRSRILWEIVRILGLPIWFLNQKIYQKIIGGFLVVYIKIKK